MATTQVAMETNVLAADGLAIYRQQVAAEKEVTSKRMSDASTERLREIGRTEKQETIEAERFRNALRSVVVTPDNIGKLIQRCNTSKPLTGVHKRVSKLLWWISAGYGLGTKINSVSSINFYSEPNDTDHLLTPALAARFSASNVVVVEERPCKSGKKCLRFAGRKPAPAKGAGEYCGTACAASDRARAKRLLIGV